MRGFSSIFARCQQILNVQHRPQSCQRVTFVIHHRLSYFQINTDKIECYLFCLAVLQENKTVEFQSHAKYFLLTCVPAGYPSYSGSKTSLMYGASIDFGISGFGVPSLSDIIDVTLSKRAFVYW